MAEVTETEAQVIDKLTDFRLRVHRGEDIPDEELKGAIELLQTFRDKTAKVAKPKSDKKATAATAKKITKQAAQDLLGDLLS